MCNYQGHEFGAQYPDSVCVDGYLWDADKCDDEGNLYGEGEWPCPRCNLSGWRSYHEDAVTEDAWSRCSERRWPFRRCKGGVLWGFWRQLCGVALWVRGGLS